ncbi:hypothetical protein OJ253_1870 [Cryptosporidium canis]|uniref:Integral membrane protein n=1 Tax=Cryptosporidium canis TaxID=195482 RepID=A0A9D5DMN2_9CRYT|nr:hypothetical protein OJ253_1870 [Cryptosporidium canis]
MSRESAKSKDYCVGPAPFGISRVLKESSNKRVFAEFVLFTVCIVLLPCGLFFLSPIFLRGFLPEQSISVVSAVLSVILVNIICGIYVYSVLRSSLPISRHSYALNSSKMCVLCPFFLMCSRAFLQEKGEWQNMGPPSTPISNDSDSRKAR